MTLLFCSGNNSVARPKSLLVCSPSTKLLSLEEAQARTQAQLGSPATTPCLSHSTDYIEVGEGPEALLGKFHTVIDLPLDKYVSTSIYFLIFEICVEELKSKIIQAVLSLSFVNE